MRAAVLDSVADCGWLQVLWGAATVADGTAHHSVGAYPALDRFLEQLPLRDEISAYFGGAPFILHAFNPATVAPDTGSYLHRVHRDVRTHAGGFRLLLNMLVMVDPFTLANGATHVLSGSQVAARSGPLTKPGFPGVRADRLTGPAGSVLLFDSNLWHAAGANTTDRPRSALTLSVRRAFVKQQMDYPRLLGEARGAAMSPWMRQLLGYNAMTPTSFEEFYRPRERRLYQADQG